MRMLRVPRNERVSFRRQLKALVAAGELLQVRGNRYGLPEKMDLVVGRLTTNPGGFGFVVPDQPDPDTDRPDLYIAAANLSEAMHGDRVVTWKTDHAGMINDGRASTYFDAYDAHLRLVESLPRPGM